MKKYCLGFAFNSDHSRVVLIRKRRPLWQAGKLNGVGGHVEPGEPEINAMAREFREETGVHATGWHRFGSMGTRFSSLSGSWQCQLYTVVLEDIVQVRTTTDEAVFIHRVGDPDSRFLPNLTALIELARYSEDTLDEVKLWYRPLAQRST